MSPKLPPMGAGIVCVLLSAGCASHQAYPPAWPALLEDIEGCEHLTGEYRDRGETAYPSRASFARVLLGDTFDAPADSVKLSMAAGEQLEVEVLADGREPVRLALPADRVTCRRGVLRIDAGGGWTGDASQLGFWVGRRSRSLELQAAGDSLIVRQNTKTTGVIIAVPLRHTGHEWLRFERVAPDPTT